MSVFGDFQRVWVERFPDSALPAAWEEDVRANLVKHKQKVCLLSILSLFSNILPSSLAHPRPLLPFSPFSPSLFLPHALLRHDILVTQSLVQSYVYSSLSLDRSITTFFKTYSHYSRLFSHCYYDPCRATLFIIYSRLNLFSYHETSLRNYS